MSGLGFTPARVRYFSLAAFKVFTAVTMKNNVFCDVASVGLVRTDVSEEYVASIFRVENPWSGCETYHSPSSGA
jgi:hypothetical protein